MRVLLDEQLPVELTALFESDIHAVHMLNRGWGSIQNGELLGKAEEEFDVLLTMDTSLRYQQNLSGMRLSIVVVRAFSTRYRHVAPGMAVIHDALRNIGEGEVVEVSLMGR